MWVGVAATAVFAWLALRGVPFGELVRTLAGARWGVLLGVSLPSLLGLVWLRALRWRHLTAPLQPMGAAPLFRAVAVGFMANNLFPLRMGEVVRSWYLGRETGASVAAIFATVMLERALDAVSVVALALLVIALWGAGSDTALARGALLLLPAALVPVAGLVLLRVAPGRVIGLAHRLLRPVSGRLAASAERLLWRLREGLGALRGGRHLLWIALDSAGIWLVASPLPILAGFWSLGLEFGSPEQTVAAAWTTQAAVGVAVALPSAPGFFGLFHYACRLALGRFGVAPEAAVAAGTLIHAVMWVSLTGLGLAVLRLRHTPLAELERVAEGGQAPPQR